MQLVTDSASDLFSEQIDELGCHVMPLTISLDGKDYKSGVDLQPADFYALLANTESFPSTSQPSAGDFADLYRRLALVDPDILSVHISSGLSGTLNAARLGAEMVPEARVTFFELADSLLSLGLDGGSCRACDPGGLDGRTHPGAPQADPGAYPGLLHAQQYEIPDPWRAYQPPEGLDGFYAQDQADHRAGERTRHILFPCSGGHPGSRPATHSRDRGEKLSSGIASACAASAWSESGRASRRYARR